LFGVTDVQVNADRVFVGGYTSDSGGAYSFGWAAAVVNATGELATDFGTAGILVIETMSGVTSIPSRDDTVFLFGSRAWLTPTAPEAGRLQRREAVDGSLLSTTECGPTSGASARQMVLGRSAFLLFDHPGAAKLRVEQRSLVDGSLVSSFGTGGILTTARDQAARIAVSGDSLYVLRGRNDSGPWQLERWSANTGELDTNFGFGGVVFSHNAEAGRVVGLAAHEQNGVYVLVGANGYALSCRSPTTGLPIAGFGAAGVVTVADAGVSPTALVLDDGTLFVAASEALPAPDSQWRIDALSAGTGARVDAFGLLGSFRRNVSSVADVPRAMTADAQGVIVVGRVPSPTGAYWPSSWMVEKYPR